MGQATKAGMWCVNEGKPVAAVKTTHGVRNALALPTWGLTAKVERWHCPNCGGPVTKDRRGSETVRLENEEKAKADFANAFDVVATVPEQVLIALREKNANELQKQFGLKKSEVSRAQNLIME